MNIVPFLSFAKFAIRLVKSCHSGVIEFVIVLTCLTINSCSRLGIHTTTQHAPYFTESTLLLVKNKLEIFYFLFVSRVNVSITHSLIPFSTYYV